uniref:Selenium-binding protein 1-A n=1 Tax=Cacopsylla melanoneura TaxID=428564 RepID=A0A8D8WLK6_9HEMI
MTPNPAKSCCPGKGPGYRTPLDAMKQGPREGLLYVICIQPSGQHPDYLAVIDVDPASSTYQQVISRCYMTHIGDELHHFGWNSCSSCYGNASCTRNKLVVPSLGSDRIYILDVSNEREPKIHKVIEPSEVHKFDVTALHTSHCLATGEAMISCMGDTKGEGKCDFLLVDPEKGEVKGLWIKGEHKEAKFGYDFWYQPHWDTLISSEWGAPKSWKAGCRLADVDDPELYGTSLNIFSYSKRTLLQVIDLGVEGIAPLEIRFLHDPKAMEGFVGCGVTGNVFRFYRQSDGSYKADKVIDIPSKKVEGYAGGDTVNAMVTDILISLDDKYLYTSNWMHGDIRQYDISDTAHPRLVGQIFLGGKIQSDSGVKVIDDPELEKQPDPVFIKGRRFTGSSQMFQLSLDGKRIYVSSSLYSPWDKEIYPDLVKSGSAIVKLNVDTDKGGLTLDEDFLVDLGKEPNGPALAHEIRYPGGDCTSDIWLVPQDE